MSETTLVKVCGLTRIEDAAFADAAGADFLGAVLTEGFGRSVDAQRARDLFRGRGARTVGVFVDADVEAMAADAVTAGVDIIQLHGSEGLATVRALRDAGSWRVWKAVRAESADDVARVLEPLHGWVDGLVVEGRLPGVVGGGGAVLDVDPAALTAAVPGEVLLILAGGLTAANVAGRVERFGPNVVDVSSGVESVPGAKDEDLVRSFIRTAKGVDATSLPPRTEKPT